MSKPPEKFSEEEASKRFRTALLGARIAGHKPMESVTPKRTKAQPKKRKKAKKAKA
jgi:hypothetical protein